MILSLLDIEPTRESILVVVIEAANLKRMRQADPITVESILKGGVLRPIKYPGNFSILIAYEDEDVELYKLMQAGDLIGLLQFLERGRKWIESVDGKKNVVSLRRAES